MITSLAIDQTIWASPITTLAGVFITAGAGVAGTVLVQRYGRAKQDAETRRLEAETSGLVEKNEDDDRDRDLQRMQKTLDFAFGALDRLGSQVESYEKQIHTERMAREQQLDEHASSARRRMDDLQDQADRRHLHVMAEVEALRDELAKNRKNILAHVPWDLQVAALVRANLDPDFPPPPEL